MSMSGHPTSDTSVQEAAYAAKIPFFRLFSDVVQSAILADLKTHEHNSHKEKDEEIGSEDEDEEGAEDEEYEENDDHNEEDDNYNEDYDAEPERKTIAATILAVFNSHNSLDIADKFLLNASFSSLLERYHGTQDMTCFNIVNFTIKSAQVTAKVHTEHDTLIEIQSTVQKFSDMLSVELEEYNDWVARQRNKTDELLTNKTSYRQFIAEISGPSIGGRAPRARESVETRTIKCWCCSQEMKYGVAVMAQKEDSPPAPVLGGLKRGLSPSAEMQDRAKLPKLETPHSAAEQGQS